MATARIIDTTNKKQEGSTGTPAPEVVQESSPENKKFRISVIGGKPQEIETGSLEEARRIALDFNNITVTEVEGR